MLIFSGITATSKIKARWMTFLGKISMPLFILHWSVGTVINYYLWERAYTTKIIFYYVGTFATALLSYFVIEYLKNSNFKKICGK